MTIIDSEFTITHTKGDTLDKTITITKNKIAFNWISEGYASGTCKVKSKSNSLDLLFSLMIDITVNGALRIYSSTPITTPVGFYFYDIEFTLTNGAKKTWFKNEPCHFII